MRGRHILRAFVILLGLPLMLAGCQSNKSGKGRTPKLAVVVVVDQMRQDHLTRFSGLYKYGLARLLREGAIFTNAHQYHALTVTAAGHASISTGNFPSHHGIIGNDWYERSEQRTVYCTADENTKLVGAEDEPGDSPFRLLVPALGDRLKKQYPGSKVFSVSRKDRAAILMGGQKPDGAYWYDGKNGRMVTSDYYMKSYPAWVDSFNAVQILNQFYEQGWQKQRDPEAYFVSREDKFPSEGDGLHTTFPHLLTTESGQPDQNFYRNIASTPFSDYLVLEFAKAIVKNEKLGEHATPDLLFVSCSAADAVGHSYGPLSQESEDLFLRLDEYLGQFIDFLDATVGHENYVLTLSSDHGVLPLPEELERRGYDSKRVPFSDLAQQMPKILQQAMKPLNLSGKPIKAMSNGLVLDYTEADARGVEHAALQKGLAAAFRSNEVIADVITYDELQSDTSARHELFDLYKNSFHPDRSPDLMLRFKEFYLLSQYPYGTSHGSPYRYDTHIPIVFFGPGVHAGEHAELTRSVDIAPTLAELLGIRDTQGMDGVSLKTVIAAK